jgi:hypothetical protein
VRIFFYGLDLRKESVTLPRFFSWKKMRTISAFARSSIKETQRIT